MDDIDRLVLDIADRRYLHAGARDEAVRVELGWTSTRWAQRVNLLLDDPAAALERPMLVARLRRVRDGQRRLRRAS